MVPRLLSLVLQFYRTPLRFPHLMKAEVPLPDEICEELGAASRVLSPAKLPQTAEALGVQPEQLRKAFRFFVQHSFLIPGAEPRRILGLPRSYSLQQLKQHHRILLRLFHPDRASGEEDFNAALSARINGAYQQLYETARDTVAHPVERESIRVQGAVSIAAPTYSRSKFRQSTPRWRWGVPLALLVILFLWWSVNQERVAPRLQINPEAARHELAEPAFLSMDPPELGEAESSKSASQPSKPAPTPIMATVLQPILRPDGQVIEVSTGRSGSAPIQTASPTQFEP